MKIPVVFIIVQLLFVCLSSCERMDIRHDNDAYSISSKVSNLNVRTIVEDSLGHIWIGTARGLNRYTGKEFYQYYNSSQENTINNSTINQMMYDSSGRCWIVTISGVCMMTKDERFINIPLQTRYVATDKLVEMTGGDIIIQTSYRQLMKYDKESISFQVIPVDQEILLSSWSRGIFTASNNTLWMVSGRKILQLDHNTGKKLNEISFDAEVSNVISAHNNQLLIYGRNEILCFDMIKRQFVTLPSWVDRPHLKEEGITKIYYGNKIGIIYTENDLYIYDDMVKSFYSADSEVSPYFFPQCNPTVIYVDTNRNIWLGTTDRGFHFVPYKGKIFNQKKGLVEALEDENINSLDSDGGSGLWAVTSNKIIHVDSRGIRKDIDIDALGINGTLSFILHRKSDDTIWVAAGGRIYNFSLVGGEEKLLDVVSLGQSVTSMIEASDGIIYLATNYGHVYSISGKQNRLRNIYRSQILEIGVARRYTSAYDICELQDGRLAVSFFRSDIMIIDPETGEVEEMNYRSQTGELYHINCLFQDNTGRFWFGSRDRGAFYMEDGVIKNLKETSASYIADIRQDDKSRIWISSAQGLFNYNPEDNSVSYFESVDNLLNNQYNTNASCRLEDGTIVFGDAYGVVTCHDVVFDTDNTFPICFEQLKVNNDIILPSEESCLKESIQTADEIRLRHWQNNISISFSLLNYQPYHTTYFKYILEGNDDTWTDIGTSNIIYLSGLKPGRYNLKVTGSNQDKGSVIGQNLFIKVYPPWWYSLVAKIIYLCLFVAVISYFYNQRQRKLRYKMNLQQARREKEHEKYLNKMNINFFGNMAHEFRSPLTMLTGPLEELYQSSADNKETRALVNTMNVSISRMNRLVNQLLDFNKLDNDALKLKLTADFDVNAKVDELFGIAKARADRYQINVTEVGTDVNYHLSIDNDKLDSIIYNLFSNAFKFTPRGGFVILKMYTSTVEELGAKTSLRKDEIHSSEYLCIDIENSGDPIDIPDIEKIFDRYYQLKHKTFNNQYSGTGIGLYFSRALAKLHHGYLWAENVTENSSVRFTLALPMDNKPYKEKDFVEEKMEKREEIIWSDGSTVNSAKDPEKKINVMVVDDDIDIANYMEMFLSRKFNVTVCYNYSQALENLRQKELPNIILTDLMMEDVDGLGLCRKIKSDKILCSIPVIIVTAKVNVDSKVEALEAGADAYITKPFEPSYIIAQINSLLKNRKLSGGKISEIPESMELDMASMSSKEQQFMNNIFTILSKELSNPELDIPYLAEKLNVSRSKLFNDIKRITGSSPNDVIKKYRMVVAAELLKSGKQNVSEVAYAVGFSSLSYFSKAFKQYYGRSPKVLKK